MEAEDYEDQIRRTCGICDKVFESETQLDEHVHEHDADEEGIGDLDEDYEDDEDFPENHPSNNVQAVLKFSDEEDETEDVNTSSSSDPMRIENHFPGGMTNPMAAMAMAAMRHQQMLLPKEEMGQPSYPSLGMLEEMVEAKKQRIKERNKQRRLERMEEKRMKERADAIELLNMKQDAGTWNVEVKLEESEGESGASRSPGPVPRPKYSKFNNFEDKLFREQIHSGRGGWKPDQDKDWKPDGVNDPPDSERRFGCPECGKRFVQAGARARHVRTVHRGERPFPCAESGCDARFGAKQQLQSHQQVVHKKGNLLLCGEIGCESTFGRDEYLQAHMRTAHNQARLVCGIKGPAGLECQESFVWGSALRRHRNKDHNKTSMSCAMPGSGPLGRAAGEPAGPKVNWSTFYTRASLPQQETLTCLTCSKVYESVNGMHYHLKTSSACTVMPANFVSVKQEDGEAEKRPKPPTYRRDYRHLYKKGPQGELECLACGVQYSSIHGLHCHLNSTSCGFGEKSSKGRVKNSYTGLYRKESDTSFVCLGCSTPYSSMHGLHYHLNRTRCGYGDQEKCQTKRNYRGLYVRREDGQYQCLGPGCGFAIGYLTGMHRHLRECPVAGMMQEQSAAMLGLLGAAAPNLGILGGATPNLNMLGGAAPNLGLLGGTPPNLGILGGAAPNLSLLGGTAPNIGLLGGASSNLGLLGGAAPNLGLLGGGAPNLSLLGGGATNLGLLGQLFLKGQQVFGQQNQQREGGHEEQEEQDDQEEQEEKDEQEDQEDQEDEYEQEDQEDQEEQEDQEDQEEQDTQEQEEEPHQEQEQDEQEEENRLDEPKQEIFTSESVVV